MSATLFMIFMAIVFSGPIIYFIVMAHAGKKIHLRLIPGLEAIEEAVGRATDMGRPIFFTPGLGSIDVYTLSALAIFKHIATLAAKYDIRIIATTPYYLVYPLLQDTCREAYAEAGKLDLFNQDDIIFMQGQFPFAMGSVGIMQREKVAATFFFGSFFAESLILAEGGSSVGAIQVAGTHSTMQLPFFIVACDYTIIGEEFLAGSAYLSKEPTMMGSLKGQDMGKLAIFTIIILGVIITTIFSVLDVEYNFYIQTLLD